MWWKAKNGGSTGNSHGRRASGHSSGQWQVGDIVSDGTCPPSPSPTVAPTPPPPTSAPTLAPTLPTVAPTTVTPTHSPTVATHSPTHGPTSMTPVPTPTPTLLPTESDGWDLRLAAYWDNGECGPRGDNYNWEWCGRWSFNCSDTVAVSTQICTSGRARLAHQQRFVSVNACTYATTPSTVAWCPTPSLLPIGTMAIVVHTGTTTIGIGVVLGRSHARRLVLFLRSSARAVLPHSWIPRCSRASMVAPMRTMHNMPAATHLLRLAILAPFVASEAFLAFCDGGYLHACMSLRLQPWQ